VLLSPEGQTEQAWEPSKTNVFWKLGKLERKYLYFFSELRSVERLSLF
jgi:hypothetical protein